MFRVENLFASVFDGACSLNRPLSVESAVVLSRARLIGRAEGFRPFSEALFRFAKSLNTGRPEFSLEIGLACCHRVIRGTRLILDNTEQVSRSLVVQEVSCRPA